MKFGLHSPSWLYDSDPHRIFEEVKRKAQWAEANGFAWFAVDLIGRYQDVGTQLLICSLYRNDRESMELLAGEVIPQFN